MLFRVVVGRRSDPSAPAGLQQQPVLLWRLNPRTTGDGETGRLLHPPHPQLLFYAKIQLNFSSFLPPGPSGAEISNRLSPGSESHEGKDHKNPSPAYISNICRTISTFMFNVSRGGRL